MRVLTLLMFTVLAAPVLAQPPGGGGGGQAGGQAAQRPPAQVVVGTVTSGVVAPTTTVEGGVFFKEVSSVATEVAGKVVEVGFEEGQRLPAGAVLVRLDASLAQRQLEEARAAVREINANLELERVRLARAEELMAEDVTTPQEYDNIRFAANALAQRVTGAEANVARIEEEIAKKTIRTPFEGIVIDRMTELGEWKAAGEEVAVFARDDLFDVVINIPQQYLPFVQLGMSLPIRVGEKQFSAEVVESAPRGDVATRTFPIKLRVAGQPGLMEGMSATASIPTGPEQQSLLVPRDAVVVEAGQSTITLVENGKARKQRVSVSGQQGELTAVSAEGLAEGMTVVTKGQERLRGGEQVQVASE